MDSRKRRKELLMARNSSTPSGGPDRDGTVFVDSVRVGDPSPGHARVTGIAAACALALPALVLLWPALLPWLALLSGAAVALVFARLRHGYHGPTFALGASGLLVVLAAALPSGLPPPAAALLLPIPWILFALHHRARSSRTRPTDLPLDQMLDLVPHLIFAKDDQGRYVYVNRAMARAFNRRVREMIGRRPGEIRPDTPGFEDFEKADRIVLREGRRVEIPNQLVGDAEGDHRYFNIIKVPCESPTGQSLVIGVATDITTLKHAETRMREQSAQLNAVFDSAAIGIGILDTEGRYRYVNRALSRMLGYGPEETLRLRFPDANPGREIGSPSRHLPALVTGELREAREERLLTRSDGTTFWGDLTLTPLQEGTGKVDALIGVVLDISRLKHSEMRFRNLFEQSTDMIMVVQRGRIALANPVFLRTLGYEAQELYDPAFSLADLVQAHDPRGCSARTFIEALRGLSNRDHLECVMRSSEGASLNVDISLSDIEWDGRPARLAMMVDVTERNRLRERVQQAQRIESVGRLAGGIAHDFNNLLTAISGHATHIHRTLPTTHEGRNDLKHIQNAIARATDMVRRLLRFERARPEARRHLVLDEMIRDMHSMLTRLLGGSIDVVLDLATPDVHVHADPTQLEQVILNLAINARDAMPEGGTLTLATSTVTLSEEETRAFPERHPGRYLRLSVSDNGTGMREATMRQIFEPFYTTKGPSKGSGLGLSMVYEIAKQHGGHVNVDSELGQGTVFHVDLPIEQEQKAGEDNGTALLLAQDEDLRDTALDALVRLGWHVLSPAGTGEAIRLLRTIDQPVRVVICEGAACDNEEASLQRLRDLMPDSGLVLLGDAPPRKDCPDHAVLMPPPVTEARMLDAITRSIIHPDSGEPQPDPPSSS